jgi:hypothetical protein
MSEPKAERSLVLAVFLAFCYFLSAKFAAIYSYNSVDFLAPKFAVTVSYGRQ